jgi:hypothetical protein
MASFVTHWKSLALIFLLSTVLVLVLSPLRTAATIDFVQPRAALKIDNFHAREYTAKDPRLALRFTQVAPNEVQAIVPAGQRQPRAIEFSIDALPQGLKRRLLAVFVDNARILDARDSGGNRNFGVIVPDSVPLTSGSVIRILTIPDDKSTPPPLTVKDVSLTAITAYRWSKDASTALFPGVSGGWWVLSTTMMPTHPDSEPFDATIRVGDDVLPSIPTGGGTFRAYHYLLAPSSGTRGDINVVFNSDTWGNNAADARTLGVAVARVGITPTAIRSGIQDAPLRFISIPVLVFLVMCAAIALQLPHRALGSVVAVGLALPMLFERVYLGMWYPHLVILFIISIVTIPLWFRVLDWLTADTPLPTQTKRLLVGLVLLTIWVKGGGILYPIMRPIDISWHMDKVREIAMTWDFAKFYQPGAFSESVMPITEWGEERPMIPYSPFIHFASLLFLVFPWSLEVSSTIFNTFLDASRIILIAVIARHGGLSVRVAWLAALLYAVTPVTFLLHAWGNVPTTTGLWWMLIATVALLVAGRSLGNRRVFVAVVLITTGAMLSYTVAAVFHVLFVTILAVLLWVVPNTSNKPTSGRILAATYGGLLIATIIYYGLYIPPIIERTIPYFLQLSTQSTASIGVVRAPFDEYIANFFPALRYDFVQNPYLYYGLYMPVLMVIPAYILMWKHRTLWTFAAAWYVVAIIFLMAGYKISMVDKQLYYIVPLLMLSWAMIADRLWNRGPTGRIIVSTSVLFTLWSALQLWIIRIDRAPLVLP